MSKHPLILEIAIPSPLRRCFDYLPPKDVPESALIVGARVIAPFRNKKTIGIINAIKQTSDWPIEKLKQVTEILDEHAILPSSLFELCQFASRYYHHPLGEVFFSAMPSLLRKGNPAEFKTQVYYRLSDEGKNLDLEKLKRAPKQAELLAHLRKCPEGLNKKHIECAGFAASHIKALNTKNLLSSFEKAIPPKQNYSALESPIQLNAEQNVAIEAVLKSKNEFQAFLLDGVTGSGKTEVYLQIISEVISDGKQVLVLIPEIGLTPQTIARFQARFKQPIVALHSGLNDNERLTGWMQAKHGLVPIIIGTRSAIFTPMQNPGLIIIDEEHDISFKQQDGFRYSARDLAIRRAQSENTPILLGSATPSLESFYNVKQGRYHYLQLKQRTGNAKLPNFHLLDLRRQKLNAGISLELLDIIKKHTQAGNQALLFINRRGYAPSLLCHQCGWVANCRRCDAHLTVHYKKKQLRCHHCDSTTPLISKCVECQSSNVSPIGQGTERIEQVLKEQFPSLSIVRIDRDSTGRKGAMEKIINEVHEGKHQILIGTQMIAKGHHFPNVTLVGVINADSGLYSTDFRATERLSQILLQVAGRAGRAEKPGEVYIQTYNHEHPVLETLLKQGYAEFSNETLKDRKAANLPPYSYFALLRAEATDKQAPIEFLNNVKTLTNQVLKLVDSKDVHILGPIPAPMERRVGKFHAQLLIQGNERSTLQKYCKALLFNLEQQTQYRKVRWHLDIDPQEMI